jgi:hypothetical protein
LKNDVVPANRDYLLGRDGSDGCFKYDKTSGSVPMHQRLKSLSVCFELNNDPNGGHVIYTGNYHVSRVYCFFRGVMQCFSTTCIPEYLESGYYSY